MQRQPRILTGLAAGGFLLGAGSVTVVAMHYVVATTKILEGLFALAVAIVVINRGGQWLIPLFTGLVWTTIGGSLFKAAVYPLIVYCAYLAVRTPLTTRRAIVIMCLLACPLVAAGLLSPLGSSVPLQHLVDVLFVFVAAAGIRSRVEVEHAGRVLAWVGALLGAGAVTSVVIGQFQYFPLATDLTSPRASGPVGDPNFFALALASLMPFAMEVYERRGVSNRALGMTSALAITAGILATGSRGGLIAAGAAVIGYAIVSQRRGARPLAGLVVATAVVLIPTLFTAQAADSQARKVSGRANENLIAATMFIDRPLDGIGPDNYPVLFRDYARRVGNDPRVLREPHSLPLQIAAEEGVIGIFGWLGLAAVLAMVARRRRILRQPMGRAVVLALLTYLAGSLFLHGSELRQLYLLVGMLLAIAKAQDEPAPAAWRG